MVLKKIQNINYHKYSISLKENPFDQFRVSVAEVTMVDQTLDNAMMRISKSGRTAGGAGRGSWKTIGELLLEQAVFSLSWSLGGIV